MTNESFISSIAKIKESNAEAEARLAAYVEGGIKQVTEEEVEQVKNDYQKYQKYWRVRRKACHEIVDMVGESCDLNRREFFE